MDLGDLGVVSHRLADPTSSMTGVPQPPTHDPAYPGELDHRAGTSSCSAKSPRPPHSW